MIRFGPWSTVLGLAAGFGLTIALMLLFAKGHRTANLLLAGLLAAVSLKLIPYVLGFAGFFDAYPWLSFAPFDLGLAFGPLLYLYALAVVSGRLPDRWLLHLAPLAAGLTYTLWAFALPLKEKMAWNDSVHAPLIDPVETWATLASLTVYLTLAGRVARTGTDAATAMPGRRWLRTALRALAAWLAVAVAFELVDSLVTPVNYFQRFYEYLAFAGVILVLGLEGWRNAEATAFREPEPERDWRSMGEQWAKRVSEADWWREPGITLGEVARRLGTNESYLSRALNEGLGINFAKLLNGMRVAEVQRRLAEPESQDLLGTALAAGFASKPAFNRVFREIAGMSPTEWRRSCGSKSRIP